MIKSLKLANVRKLLWKYIYHYRKPANEKDAYVFVNHSGQPLTSDGAEQPLIEVKRRAGIERVLPMAISRDGAPHAPCLEAGLAHEAHHSFSSTQTVLLGQCRTNTKPGPAHPFSVAWSAG